MQTILGAGGAIGNGLAEILPTYSDKIRIVSRNPKKINDTDELVKSDLTNAAAVDKSVEGSDVVYLTAGLQYDIKVWQEVWPKIMMNVLDACKKHKAKLVFFDNVYMYGKVNGWMTESTPINPCSKKGELRAKIAEQLLEETQKGNVEALIARAADFYGPNCNTSILNLMVFDKLKNNKSAQWMINANVKHSFTYTPDAAKATAILGNTPDAFNRVWHVPTHKNVLTGKEIVELAASRLGVKPKYMVLKKWLLQLTGLMDSTVKELVEMLYQFEDDYLFDSGDFENKFFKATDYKSGIESSLK